MISGLALQAYSLEQSKIRDKSETKATKGASQGIAFVFACFLVSDCPFFFLH